MRWFKILLVSLYAVSMMYAQSALLPIQDARGKAPISIDGSRLSPRLLNYQGYLTDDQGIPITNPSLSMTFSIYDALTSGNLKWTETQTSVDVNKGVFSVLLGSVTPMPDSVFTNSSDRWLELIVDAQTFTPRTRITSVGYAYTSTHSDTADYARNAAADNDWVVLDSVLYTGNYWGIARGGTGNALLGSMPYTHVNFGVECTTGVVNYSMYYCTVGGGNGNVAADVYTTIGGGRTNTASDDYATVGGGWRNTASGIYAVVGGGGDNTASAQYTTIGGGVENAASNQYAAVSGGGMNMATGIAAVVSGGLANTANDDYASIGGGYINTTSGDYATVGGGNENTANGYAVVGGGYHNSTNAYGTIPGGYGDTTAAWDAFAANYSTRADHQRSAAFTTSHTTASDQVRAAAFSTGTLDFAMDHPDDPMNKILNQYAVGSDEVLLIYSGSTLLDANGRAEVMLPDYFDDINRNPRIQLSGVGSSDVHVAEDIIGNRFVIGGKPGMKVYWEVTGERKDIHAEIARIQTPVEQQKTGTLIGHSLNDDALLGVYDRLQQEKPGMFSFITDEGRRVYEQYRNREESSE